jgi:hypothetical protein
MHRQAAMTFTRVHLTLAVLAIACSGQVESDGNHAAGGAGGGGGMTATGGGAGLSECESIEGKYGLAFGKAASCNIHDESPTCTYPLKSALSCGCSTYVNAANSDAIDELADLGAEWQAAGCVIPCPLGCPAPQAAVCQQDRAGTDAGTCSPVY